MTCSLTLRTVEEILAIRNGIQVTMHPRTGICVGKVSQFVQKPLLFVDKENYSTGIILWYMLTTDCGCVHATNLIQFEIATMV